VIRKAVLRRYARSLAEVAHEASQADAVRADFEQLLALTVRVPDFLTAMRNPVVPQETKRAIVDDIARRLGLSNYFAQFLRVLVDHHRIPHVAAIGELYDEEVDALAGVVRARVSTARPLLPARQDWLGGELRRVLQRTVSVDAAVEPDLIGGLRLQVGGTVYDGTVRNQLQRLKRRLAES
jgi:F-type H+-transporting ATPase subunit delta